MAVEFGLAGLYSHLVAGAGIMKFQSSKSFTDDYESKVIAE